ncbi:MAG TPA: VCBS domain-containing protein, partial [Ramlibacter sp.]|nr:VCBS domain-containing protein [Ramlibacter sp.]
MAGYTFVNAYAVDTALTPAGKEQNSVDFFDTSLGIASISDSTGNFNFSGNDVSAIGIDIGGVTYNGWISRPIKSGGEVKGFYFWTDPDFTTLAAAQADGNTDGDGNPYDNLGFVLVVDQSYFDGLSEISSGIKSVGSSSDRVDTALNSLLVTNSAPVAIADTATAKETGGLNNDGASHTLDGTSPTGNVLSNDTDVNAGDTHSVTAAGTSAAGTSVAAGSTSTSSASTIVGQYGTLSIGADGTYKYVVNDSNSSVESLRTSSDTLTDTFTYKMADQAGATSTTTLTVTITGQNDTPTANADYNTAKEATTLATSGITFAGIAAAGNVLTNDTDKDSGDGKTLSGSSVSTTGSVSSNSLVWVTDPGAVATGKYIYINGTPLYDNSGLTTSAHQLQFATQSADHLTMTFNLTPSAAALALLNGTNTLDLYSNAGGTGAAGSVTTDFTMGGSATVSVASVAGIAVGAAVSGTGVGGGVTVTAVNNATETVTLSSAISITAGTSLNFGTSSISSSGTTFYGDHGTLVLKSDGSYTYTPKTDDSSISSGQSASDTFHYTMQDTAGATSSSTLTITVYGEGSNDPTATADTNSIGENTATVSKATSGTGLLSNDSSGTAVAGAHSVGSAAEVAIGTNTSVAGQYGTLTLSSDGTYTYTLNTANGTVDGLNAGQSLTDTFVYRDTNAPTSSGSAVSTLTITINGVDDNPLAVNDTATATEKSGLNNATAGYNPSGNVLANDTDVDNAASSLSVGSIRTGSAEGSGTAGTLGSSLAGSYGSVTLNANGTWSYTVDETNATVNALSAGSTLTDSFNYTVSDGSGGSDTAVLTVTIQGAADTLAMNSVFVNEASPYAVFQVTGVQGTPLTLALSDTTGLSANDTKATLGTDVANTLEYYNGSSWVTYSGSATIPSGGTLLVRVAINNDTTYEGNESFSLTASSTWSDASSATGIGTIGDEGSGDVYNGTNTTGTADGSGADDDRPTVSITSPTVTESAGYATFTVSLDHASTQAIHFTPTVSSGTATVGTDTAAASTLEYSSDGGGTWHTVSGAVEIAAGATSVQLRIAITDDSTYEGNESFTLATGYIADAVQNPSGVTGTATITDAADTPTISVADTSATEGTSAVFTVSLDHASTTAVSFTPSLTSGTATVGTDTAAATALEYSSDGGGSWHTASGAVTIAAGDTSVQLRIATIDDTTYEGSEAFTLSTGSVTGTVTNGTGASGTATIDDNDVAPTLAIDSVTVN